MRLLKRCNKIGCRVKLQGNETYCQEHTNHYYNEYNKNRYRDDKEYVSFYSSKAWRGVRHQAMLRDEFLCQRCLLDGLYSSAKIGDHIIPSKEDWARRLDLTNIQSLCIPCHNIKTREDEYRYSEE